MSKKYNLAFYAYFIGSNSNEGYKIPPLPSEIYDCYFYTNNKNMYKELEGTKWKVIFVDRETTDDLIESNLVGKFFKVLPYQLNELKNYDYTCYLDTKLEKLNINFIEKLIEEKFINDDYALLLREHPFIKNNVYEELYVSMSQPRYQMQRIRYIDYINNQLERGLSSTTKHHSTCHLLIRNMKHRRMIDFNNVWYNHIQVCGIQDQISFFFVKQLFEGFYYSFSENPFE